MAEIELTQETFSMARWPHNTPESYITARNELLKEENALRAHIERVAAQRRALPKSAVMPSYSFSEGPADLALDGPVRTTTLADLAADGRSVASTTSCSIPPTRSLAPCARCSWTTSPASASTWTRTSTSRSWPRRRCPGCGRGRKSAAGMICASCRAMTARSMPI